MPSFKKKTSFRTASVGLCLIEGVEITFDDRSAQKNDKGDSKGILAIVKVKTAECIQHPDDVGIPFQDTFPLWTDFGFERFGGLMLSMFPDKFKADKDYPLGFFNDDKVQKKISKGFAGTHFGSDIRIDKVLKQDAKPGSTDDSDYLTFNKLGDVYDKDEYKDASKSLKAAANGSGGAGTSGGSATPEGGGSGDDDEWE